MKTLSIISVDYITDSLNSGQPPKYEGYALPLSILSTGNCIDATLGKVEYTEAMVYDSLVETTVSHKAMSDFSAWVHFLCTDSAPTLDSDSLLFEDFFQVGDTADKVDTFSISTAEDDNKVQQLLNELKGVFYLLSPSYSGDCDLSSFILLEENSDKTDKEIRKLIKNVRLVHGELVNHLSLIHTQRNSSLVIGYTPNLNTANVN